MECENITYIDIFGKQVKSLQGIEHFPALQKLKCNHNEITSLDVSKNPALVQLSCNENPITSLDVSQNPSLAALDCNHNKLTSLDVSKNTVLRELVCSKNQLTTLNTGNNHTMMYLDCGDNQLTELDVSQNPALIYLNCAKNQLTRLDLQEHTALLELNCANNQLTELDMSQNPALENIICADNQLSTLDISKNPSLKGLHCSNNRLSTLDASKHPALEQLTCDENQLIRIDVSESPFITELTCRGNRLTELDVSQNPALSFFSCASNQLTTLDVRKNSALQFLMCGDNDLTTLDLQNNTDLMALECTKNQLTSLDLRNNSKLVNFQVSGNRYPLPQKTDFDYTTLPGSFDVSKISNVVGGSFDPETHTFRFDEGKTCATYTYDLGNEHTETFMLHFNPFEDVKIHHFYYDSVIWAVNEKITDGITSTTFAPEHDCTRAQVVTFLWRAAGSPRPESYGNSPFQDVQDPSTFYYEAVLWAAEKGITDGITTDTFKPEGVCTRGQVVTFLWRFKDQPEPQNPDSSFVDVQDAGRFYYKAVLWATENKITDGVAPNVFRPEGTCKRGQIVTFLYRCLNQG